VEELPRGPTANLTETKSVTIQAEPRTTPLFVLHILATCVISLYISGVFWAGQSLLTVNESIGFDEQIVISLATASIILYVVTILIRKRKVTKVKPWVLYLVTAGLYFFALDNVLTAFVDGNSALILSVSVAAFYFLCANFPHTIESKIGLPLLTIILSVSIVLPFVLFLPLLVIGLISVGYGLYDIFAVFWGPLGKLIASLKDQKKLDLLRYSGLVTPIRGRMLGLGDSVFYSLLFSSVYLNLGRLAGVLSLAGIILGFLLTFKLAKSKPMPALPLSVALGLGFALVGMSI